MSVPARPVLTNLISMWPLLKRDGQGIEYIALLLLWNLAIGYNPFTFSRRSYLRMLSTVSYTRHFYIIALCSQPGRSYVTHASLFTSPSCCSHPRHACLTFFPCSMCS